MGKVSIGLRGWRFDEDEVFTETGDFRPMDEIPSDPRKRLVRLQALSGSPCDACWLIHGDEAIHECNEAEVVYGEPLGEVVLCTDHEPDFLYWFSEEGGDQYKGEQILQDEFHEWFADGGRAPEGYGGLEHVETDPDDIPEPPEPDQEALNVELPEDERKRIDLRNVEAEEETDVGERADSTAAENDAADAEKRSADAEKQSGDAEDDDDEFDLGMDYPSS